MAPDSATNLFKNPHLKWWQLGDKHKYEHAGEIVLTFSKSKCMMSLFLFRKATMARLFSSSHAAELVLILYDSVRLCLRCEALMGLHGLCVQLEGKHENTHLTFVYIRLLLNLYALVHFQMADLALGLKTKRLMLHQQGLSAFWVILQCLVSKDPFNVSMVFLHVHFLNPQLHS